MPWASRALFIFRPIVAAMVVVQFVHGAAATATIVVAALLAMLGVRLVGRR